ncbi:MAG: hypothetical protein ABI265_10015 [Gallionella sp.]
MSRYLTSKLLWVLLAISFSACQTIPEWDKEIPDNPVDDGRCPDISGRFNYEHLKWKNIREWDPILQDDLPDNLPADGATPANYKPGFIKRGVELIPIPFSAPGNFYPGHYGSVAIYNKIHKGKINAYSGMVTVTLTHSDQVGRKYHLRVDWDKERLLGEYDFKFDDMWVCSDNKFIRTAKSTLYERPDPDEINPKDYRRIHVLPNGNIRIDRKHTFIARWDRSHLARYYVSLVFAKVP